MKKDSSWLYKVRKNGLGYVIRREISGKYFLGHEKLASQLYSFPVRLSLSCN
jgi:hypothetical protein